MAARKTKTDSGPVDLGEVIGELRQLMRRAVRQAEEPESFEQLVDFMEKYSRASTRLANLLKAQRELAEEQGLAEAIQLALAGVVTEMEKEKRGGQPL